MAHLDGAVLHGVEHLQCRNDLAAGEDLDLELAVGRFRDIFGEGLVSAIQRVERLRPARSQSPLERRHRLRNRRLGDGRCRGCRGPCPNGSEKFTAFHNVLPLSAARIDGVTNSLHPPSPRASTMRRQRR